MSEQFTNTVNCGFPKIEGVPVGTRIIRLGFPQEGAYIPDNQNPPKPMMVQPHLHSNWPLPILAPDNVYGVVDLESVPIPDGWERDGSAPEFWFRKLTKDSTAAYWLGHNCAMHGLEMPCSSWCLGSVIGSGDPRRIILRRKKTKRRYLVGRWPVGPDYTTAKLTAWVRLMNWTGSFSIEEVEE